MLLFFAGGGGDWTVFYTDLAEIFMGQLVKISATCEPKDAGLAIFKGTVSREFLICFLVLKTKSVLF